jgi:hypothetical protein
MANESLVLRASRFVGGPYSFKGHIRLYPKQRIAVLARSFIEKKPKFCM